VRRETGKEYGVKVSDDKDVASHIDPKPCVVAREGEGEASVGACAGRKLSLEIYLLGADARGSCGRQYGDARYRESALDPAWS